MNKQLSFEDALVEANALLDLVQGGGISDTELQESVSRLVATPPGARGFLVNYLTSDLQLADETPPAVLNALRSGPDVVFDLLAKNLVMSTTMALTHERNDDPASAQGSYKVQRRTAAIIKSLESEKMSDRLLHMWESVSQGRGDYVAFLERWGYDKEQLLKAQEAIRAVREG